jgi:hypothetical protein
MKIAVIDSGYDIGTQPYVSGIALSLDEQGALIVSDDVQDAVGHGTAICGIIHKYCNAEIYMVRYFRNERAVSPELLVAALDYVYANVKCDVVLISSGVLVCDMAKEMERSLNLLDGKSIIVVAAFSNDGAMSYPAALDSAIGIDSAENLKKLTDYIFAENSPVNIIGALTNFRADWLNGKKNIVKGSSFTAAYFAGVIANIVSEQRGGSNAVDRISVLTALKSKATNCISFDSIQIPSKGIGFARRMKKILAFPFSKEINALAAFENLLVCDDIQYCDIRQSGRVGQRISKLYPHISNDKIIFDYSQINWSADFDGIVLGHCEVLNSILNRNIQREVIDKCQMHNKCLYSFDYIENAGVNVFSPYIDRTFVPRKNLGKLWQSRVPIIGVFGTSSRQGKYTLQLMLRRMFQAEGYKVRQIGTEPSGYLFDFNAVYPMGYNSSVFISGIDAATTLNEIVHQCEINNPDIILTGSQSGTTAYDCANASLYPIPEYEFLLGTQPDFVILCVNRFDAIDYITGTVRFIESAVDCIVGACVVFPAAKSKPLYTFDELKELIMKNCGVPAYNLESDEDIKLLFEKSVSFFTKE